MTNLHNIRTTDITLERLIPAGPAAVFDAWLDSSHPGSPWHGVVRVILQARPDGLFYRMHRSDGDGFELAHYGRFTAIERPGRIQHTWVSQHTRGLESLVTIDLRARGGQTLITLRHEGVPDDDMGRLHKAGWSHYLDILADRLHSSPETRA